MNADDHLLQFVRAREEIAGFDLEFLVLARKISRLRARVRAAELRHNSAGRESIGREPLRIEHHAHLARLPADDRGLGNVVQLLQRIFELGCDPPQLVCVVILAPERERENRHVVDRSHLDNRLRNSLRNAVKVRIQLVVGLDDRVFFVRAHVEAHGHHAQPGMAHRVDVLDARYLAQQLFHRHAGALRHFLGRRARHLDENVQHRHGNLRFLLARRLPDAESAKQQRGHDQQRRQLRTG